MGGARLDLGRGDGSKGWTGGIVGPGVQSRWLVGWWRAEAGWALVDQVLGWWWWWWLLWDRGGEVMVVVVV